MIRKKSLIVMLSIILFVFIAVIFTISYSKSTDVSMLIEKNLTNQYNKKTQIDIYDTYDILEYKVIGFTIVGAANRCGIAILRAYNDSQFELIEVKRFEKLVERALDIYITYISLDSTSYLAILSTNTELSRVEMTINGKESSYKEVISAPSLTLFEYPNESFTSEYSFYDKAGNLIRS